MKELEDSAPGMPDRLTPNNPVKNEAGKNNIANNDMV